jgi:hypothetical protein
VQKYLLAIVLSVSSCGTLSTVGENIQKPETQESLNKNLGEVFEGTPVEPIFDTGVLLTLAYVIKEMSTVKKKSREKNTKLFSEIENLKRPNV